MTTRIAVPYRCDIYRDPRRIGFVECGSTNGRASVVASRTARSVSDALGDRSRWHTGACFTLDSDPSHAD